MDLNIRNVEPYSLFKRLTENNTYSIYDIIRIKLLKVTLCKFENLPIVSFSYENNILRISHLNTFTFRDIRT